MSGKEPPRAPRALLHTFGSAAASAASSTTTSATASSIASAPAGPSRIGGIPPTGPRSLVNGHSHSSHPALRVPARGKPFVNGHGALPAGPAAISPPTGPSARFSHKGKQVEDAWPAQNASDGVNLVFYMFRQRVIEFRLTPPFPFVFYTVWCRRGWS